MIHLGFIQRHVGSLIEGGIDVQTGRAEVVSGHGGEMVADVAVEGPKGNYANWFGEKRSLLDVADLLEYYADFCGFAVLSPESKCC